MDYDKDENKVKVASNVEPPRADAAPAPRSPLAKSLLVVRNNPAKAKVGAVEAFSIELTNNTDEALEVSGSFLPLDHPSSAGSPQAFRLREISPAPVRPGRDAMAIMHFRPTVAGNHRATLELKIEGRSELTRVDVSGIAEGTAQKEDSRERSKGEPVPVGLVDLGDYDGQKKLSYDKMLQTWAELVETGLNNFDAALSNFETVARSPSSKESVPEDAAKLVWEEIHKHHVDHLVSYMFKPLPWGSEFGEFFSIGSWNEAVSKEKQRAKRAGEDHVLMKFVIATRTWITETRGKFNVSKIQKISQEQQAHQVRNDVGQTLDRSNVMAVNGRLSKLVMSGMGTIAGQYQNIVCQWTNGSKAPGGDDDAHVKIRYDKNWKLMSTKLVAIHGQRLAEQLFDGERTVDLHALPVRRIVEWMPYLEAGATKAKLEQKVFNFQGVIDASGAHVKTRYSPMAQAHKSEFDARIAGLRLPVVSEMQGSASR